MSHKASILVWDHSQTRGAMRCLMLAIADMANDDGIAWPGTAKLAEKIRESKDYTDVLIKKCEDLGELAKVAGRGRGHPTRFAILCGCDEQEIERRKGVLQNPYYKTPIAKGVLQSEKRGTFSDTKQPPRKAPERAGVGSPENEIHHDPYVGGGGGGTAPKKQLPEHVVYLIDQGVGAAEEFATLDPQTAIRDYDNRRADGISKALIVKAWRANPPVAGKPYERKQVPDRVSQGRTVGRVGRRDNQPDLDAMFRVAREQQERRQRRES